MTDSPLVTTSRTIEVTIDRAWWRKEAVKHGLSSEDGVRGGSSALLKAALSEARRMMPSVEELRAQGKSLELSVVGCRAAEGDGVVLAVRAEVRDIASPFNRVPKMVS